ncbi:MAG TPA: glycogen debranching N-terminal domain-containing protein [Candidatus Sulfotelmatobacter sp.]|nr:glycogen debranching N-terminal domain-containing protein [Candidatus Sulfotelmatobacter sp.]
MDRTGTVGAQYYIATTESRADDRARVLKYGKLFFVFDRLGDVTGRASSDGLFCEGTRYLSDFCFTLWDARPLLLSSTVAANNFLFTADLANLDVFRGDSLVVPRGVLHVLRSRFLWRDSCFEKLLFVNHGLETLEVPVRIGFDADFADLFEVRGTARKSRGARLESKIDANSVVLGYQGLDTIVRELTIQSDINPDRCSEAGFEFALSIRPKDHLSLGLELRCGDRPRPHFVPYAHAAASAKQDLADLAEFFPRITSSNSRFSDWIERSISDLEMMIAGNPEHNYPYAGVPWFSTVFGRDGIITALQTLWLNPNIAKGVLTFLAASQADSTDPIADAQPGKILHEMRNSEMARLGEVPFGRYYGSVDATPLFVILANAYFVRAGDRDFLKNIWPHVSRALAWIDKYGDLDGDGFVEYSRHSANGLIQQGWKDSNDSVFHEDGSIAEAPIALCEVQGYVYAAKLAAAHMAGSLGEADLSRQLETQAKVLKARFQEAFWCDELGIYALALDSKKNACRVRASNAGHSLFSGIATPDRANVLAETLMSEEFFTGWGIRTVAHEESRYNPLSYHNGSVWPHDNSIIANGMARIGCRKMAGQILLALLDLSAEVELHRLPELICGLKRRVNEGPTLYPVACAPQSWAAATPFFILEGCLGITVDAARSRIMFDRPFLPEGIPQLHISNLRCGKAVADLVLERRGDAVLVHPERISKELEIVTVVAN